MSSNIEVKLDVLNQKASPALYAAPLANRPAASFTGRLFVDSDSPSTGLYRDTGSTWVQVADAGAGTTGTLQQVTTNGNTTSIGISVTANGIGIGVAAPAANLLDIHGTTGVLAQLENTTTQNSLLSFRNQGAGVWSIGNGYNAGANDFIVYDAVSFVNRLTIKATGQTFIGADTTSSGLFVVNSATSDNHIVILGANAPSLRFRNAGTGGTLNAGIGISTATNNFIQGSASGNFCLFNSSTTASPILFGIYDSGAGNTVEAARISAARNFLVNTVTDNGSTFQVSGNSTFSGRVNVNGATDNASYKINTIGTMLLTQGDFIQSTFLNASAIFYYQMQKARGTSSVPLALNNNDLIGGFLANGFDGTNYKNNSRIEFKVTGAVSAGVMPTSIRFLTGSTSANLNMSLNESGILNITNTPIYATNALALAGGLVVGDIYKSAIGVLSIVY